MKRALTINDIAEVIATSAEAAEPAHVFDAIWRIAAETCGFRLLTVLQYDEAVGEVVRRYSSDPAYPVGGRKALAAYTINHAAVAADGYFLAGTRAAVAEAYADHERLFALGITAILNAPIRSGGRRLGTLNLSGSEGQYGAPDVRAACTLAGLLAPTLLAMTRLT